MLQNNEYLPVALDYPFLKKLPSRREFYRFARSYLLSQHQLTPQQLEELARQDEDAALNIVKSMYAFHIRKWEGPVSMNGRQVKPRDTYLYLKPDQYDQCPEKELWKSYRFRPEHLRQRRGIESTPAFKKLFTGFQDAYNPMTDKYLSLLVELGSLNDMKTIRSLSQAIAGESVSYCKVERPGKSKELKHHLHMCVLATPETIIPKKVGKYNVQVQELGQGKYADDPILANLHTFMLYLHKPYDARIFAKGNNTKNLYRLLLEDFLSYDPNLKRQPTPIRRWALNLPY